MNILITGINGFVGSNITAELHKRHKLYGLDITKVDKEEIEKTYSWGELNDISSIDAVVHLAGKAHDTDNKSEAKSYFDINTGLTQKVFDWFMKSDAKAFVFFSSVKAAADVVPGDVLTEEVKPKPVGPYGESKIKAEEYILSKRNEYEKLGKRVYIVRPCMIHGAGNKGNLNLLYGVISKGIPWPLGAFENRRSFCSVDNIVYVVEQLCVREDVKGGIYHVGDDDALSTNELIALIGRSMGKRSRIWHLPKGLMNGAATVGGWLRLPLNTFRLQKLTENYVVSNDKIKLALGIEKMPTSARAGLIKTFESFKE